MIIRIVTSPANGPDRSVWLRAKSIGRDCGFNWLKLAPWIGVAALKLIMSKRLLCFNPETLALLAILGAMASGAEAPSRNGPA